MAVKKCDCNDVYKNGIEPMGVIYGDPSITIGCGLRHLHF